MTGVLTGTVTDYFGRIGVAEIKLRNPLGGGDWIHIVGPKTDFQETVESMEIDHSPVDTAQPGEDVALMVKNKVREGDKVYR